MTTLIHMELQYTLSIFLPDHFDIYICILNLIKVNARIFSRRFLLIKTTLQLMNVSFESQSAQHFDSSQSDIFFKVAIMNCHDDII